MRIKKWSFTISSSISTCNKTASSSSRNFARPSTKLKSLSTAVTSTNSEFQSRTRQLDTCLAWLKTQRAISTFLSTQWVRLRLSRSSRTLQIKPLVTRLSSPSSKTVLARSFAKIQMESQRFRSRGWRRRDSATASTRQVLGTRRTTGSSPRLKLKNTDGRN